MLPSWKNNVTEPASHQKELRMNRGAERVVWLDAAKGLGIVLVVFGHVLRGTASAGILPAESPAFQWTDFSLYTFHMPLFFVLAGWTVQYSLNKGKLGFLRSKIPTVVYPYLLWSLIQGGIQLLFPGAGNNAFTVQNMLGILVVPIGQFWFLYTLMACHLILVLWPGSRWILIAAGLLVMTVLEVVRPIEITLWPTLMIRVIIFYFLGVEVSRRIATPSASLPVTALIAVTFIVAVIAAFHLGGRRIESIWAMPAGALGLTLLILMATRLNGRVLVLFTRLGEYSLSIYVMHIICAAGARVILSKVLHITDPTVHILVGVGIGIIAPVAVHLVLKRFSLLPFLGLAAPRKRQTVAA
jgi:fucose 4-O-acetylase-like acetyltransferase